MQSHLLHGVVPALVTPFRTDELIDYGAWQAIIDALIGAGVDGLFVAGSAGEFFSLDDEERIVAFRFCKQAMAGRATLYGNVGCVSTRASVKLAQLAEAEGVDCLVVVTPFFVKPSQDELADHVIEICRAVRAPVLVYNIPVFSGGVEILPPAMTRIASLCENFAGVKASVGSVEKAAAYIACGNGRDLSVFMGNDELVLAGLQAGCVGTVAACANVAPRLFVDLYRAFRDGRQEDAARLQTLVTALQGSLPLHTFPGVVKEAMAMIGLPAGPCRKPIGSLPPHARTELASVVDRLRAEKYLPEVVPAS